MRLAEGRIGEIRGLFGEVGIKDAPRPFGSHPRDRGVFGASATPLAFHQYRRVGSNEFGVVEIPGEFESRRERGDRGVVAHLTTIAFAIEVIAAPPPADELIVERGWRD